jgi:putative endonuclease
MVNQSAYSFGKAGEEAAATFLKKKGYKILEMNFRTKTGEIDIVAEHKRTVAFIEVKSRSNISSGHPEAAVNDVKQRKLFRVAELFLAKYKITERACRFDIVAISGDPQEPNNWEFRLTQDAFRLRL